MPLTVLMYDIHMDHTRHLLEVSLLHLHMGLDKSVRRIHPTASPLSDLLLSLHLRQAIPQHTANPLSDLLISLHLRQVIPQHIPQHISAILWHLKVTEDLILSLHDCHHQHHLYMVKHLSRHLLRHRDSKDN